MKEKFIKWGLIGIFIAILALPIIIDANRRGRVQIISFDRFIEVLHTREKALIYFGDTEAENFDSIRESLHLLREDFEIDVYAVNMASLSTAERGMIESELFEEETGYVFIRAGDIPHAEAGSLTLNRLRPLVDRHLFDTILEEETAYTIPESAEEYLAALSGRNNVVMTVFGTDECPFCRQYAVTFNFLARDYNFNVFYVNETRMNTLEHRAIMDSDLMIPSKCITGDEDIPVGQMQGVPLTLFTRNGVVFDCIRGVVSRIELHEILQDVGIISETN